VARCGDITITTEELGSELLTKLDSTDIRETAWHMLLLKSLEEHMPDLSAKARAAAVHKEMQRRRAKTEAMAAGQGQKVSFEDVLHARGTSVDFLQSDPSVAIAALSRLWIDRTEGDDGLRRTFEAERGYFEDHFGTALHTYAHFLVAGAFQNDVVKRSFADADAELEKLKTKLTDLAGFQAWAAKYSEDPTSRSTKGNLGWITRADPRFPESMRKALFEYADGLTAAGNKIPATGKLIGPIHFESGSALLLVTALRPTPGWDQMREIVNEELRRRLIEKLMPLDAVEMVVQ